MLSIMVLDALGNNENGSDSQIIGSTENLGYLQTRFGYHSQYRDHRDIAHSDGRHRRLDPMHDERPGTVPPAATR